MAALSIIHNMPALTLSDLQNIQNQAFSDKHALFEKYQALYPNALITNLFLLDIARAEKADRPCKNCQKYCAKFSNKGSQHYVAELYGELYVKFKPCPFAKIAINTRNAHIPPMYLGKSFADYKVDSNNSNAFKGAQLCDSLYIFGKPGTGKTFLAALMAQQQLLRGKSVIFTDTPSLLEQMKNTFDGVSDLTLESLMKKLERADLLVLDDLGTETPTQWAVERLYLVINARYNAGKSLIVTSNYDPEQAADRLNNPFKGERGVTGSRIVSRIRGICKVVQILGNDRRRN